jgi:hypothetical protein
MNKKAATLFYYGNMYSIYLMSFALLHQNKNKKADSKATTSAKPSPHRISTLAMASDSIIHLQCSMGNQAAQKLMRSNAGFDFGKIGIQPKLRVSQPGDLYEREADRVAEQVMGMSVSNPISSPVSNEEERLDRKCSSCEMKKEKEEEMLNISRKHSTLSNFEVSNEITNEISNTSSRSGGYSLKPSIREYMESRFGYNFSKVRIHTDERAERSANSVNALAYTVGNDIVFGEGHYQPDTLEGQRLIAHKLTHVIQQEGKSDPTVQRSCSDPNFCKPYATTAEADSAKWWIRNTYLRAEGLKFGSESKGLYESFLSRSPGNSLVPVVFNSDSSDLVSSFKESGDTTDDMDNVIDLVGSRLSRAPSPLRDYSPTTMSLSNFLSKSEMENRPINYSNPLSIAGHVAGGIGSSDAGKDYRKIIYANVTLEKITLIGSTGYVSVELTPQYEVFDAVDFCPGDCGSPAEQYVTIPMSRLEESGAAYDVPFKVIFAPQPRSKRFWF